VLFERVRTPLDLAYTYSEVSRMWEEKGDKRRARSYKSKAERIMAGLRKSKDARKKK